MPGCGHARRRRGSARNTPAAAPASSGRADAAGPRLGILVLMCGRFAYGRDPDDLAVAFGSIRAGEAVPPRWNIAPTDPVPIVLDQVDRTDRRPVPVRQLRAARWARSSTTAAFVVIKDKGHGLGGGDSQLPTGELAARQALVITSRVQARAEVLRSLGLETAD